MINRYIANHLKEALEQKMVLLTGPRQSGKTTLTKQLFKRYQHLNYDFDEHRAILNQKSWDRTQDLVILDELHKKKSWKRWLKGIYDVEGNKPAFIVTESARLDHGRKMGDSLAGRHWLFRLHPFDVKEVKSFLTPEEAFQRILTVGGFPEPFMRGQLSYYKRWKRTHQDIIIRQDLLELENVRSIKKIEQLIELLSHRVGSHISYSHLARNLEVDHKTIAHWLSILENLYVIFRVTPYSKKVSASLLKAPKFYFYDVAQVKGDEGARFENLVACALKKEMDFCEDTLGDTWQLHYLRNKEGAEVDFLMVKNEHPYLMLECKWSDQDWHRPFFTFERFIPQCRRIQLVAHLREEKTLPDQLTEMRKAAPWLAAIDFSN